MDLSLLIVKTDLGLSVGGDGVKLGACLLVQKTFPRMSRIGPFERKTEGLLRDCFYSFLSKIFKV
jgi:hypothetical protein